MRIVWTSFAKDQLRSIHVYYKSTAGKKRADEIKNKILRRTKTLTDFPESGAKEENEAVADRNYRYLVSGNYKVIYKTSENEVVILTVFDTRRNPEVMAEIADF
jgi:toxin ParE1/3/4